MAGVSGDFAELERIAATFGAFERRGVQRRLARDLAQTALGEVRGCFISESDPYGTPWLPRKKRGDGHAILYDRGKLFRSFRVHLVDGGFEIESAADYASVHQDGATLRARTQVNAHSRSGRFQSRARAEKRKAGAVRVSIARIGATTVPRRPLLPDDARGLGPIWSYAFETTADRLVEQLFAAAA